MKTYGIKILNGVNLDLLGTREPHIYGAKDLMDLEKFLRDLLKKWSINHVELSFFQSNQESEFLNSMTSSSDAMIINAGAWSHTSLAIADRLKAIHVPYIEVHLSNVFDRETYRHHSWLSPRAVSVVSGGGFSAYSMALWGLIEHLRLS
ncbi:MAG: type II 3-dehydroquinate dehydratase [Oligoflexales bacterium]